MSKLNVGIICGGRSVEREISLKSAIRLVEYIDKRRFDVIVIWIDSTGCWFVKDVYSDNFFSYVNGEYISILLKQCPQKFIFRSKNKDVVLTLDIIFPIVHGTFGEDGSLQGLLRIMDIPFVGSDVLSSSIGMNKDISKCLLRDAGLSVLPFKTFMLQDKYNLSFDDLVSTFGLPFFVKPVDQGSSIGVSKVLNDKDFYKAINTAFSFSHKILIEPAITGKEIECAVLGNDYPEISVCGEIVLEDNNFYTYYNKYMTFAGNVHSIIPANIDIVMSNKIRYLAFRAFQVLHCSGMARIDFFLNALNHEVFINEVNTLPGFTDTSMYVKLWEASGLNLQTLITKLIELSLERYTQRKCNVSYINDI